MINIQSNEMKTHLSGVLRQVEQGQEFLITKHKKIVARLVPYLPDSIGAMEPEQAVAAMKQLKKVNITRDEVHQYRQSGHR